MTNKSIENGSQLKLPSEELQTLQTSLGPSVDINKLPLHKKRWELCKLLRPRTDTELRQDIRIIKQNFRAGGLPLHTYLFTTETGGLGHVDVTRADIQHVIDMRHGLIHKARRGRIKQVVPGLL